ncbi:MAG TPA: glycosyltransferase family 4 protein [Ignavibacteria bacterium]|nr:glycosyltransferase family 4 protein [Ignavibacteria bacterium]
MSGSEKILMISSEFPPGPGGIGNHGYNLANNLKRNNKVVKVLTMSDYVEKKAEEEFDKKVNFEIVRFKRYPSRLKTYKERIDIIKDTIRNESFTDVIFSGRFPLLISNLIKRDRNKLKFTAIAHGAEINSDNFIEKKFIDRALSNMDLIIPVSNYTKSKLSPSLDKNKITVIPNGFDMENISEIKINKSRELSDNLNLITVGTIWPRKGHHNVLNAFGEILKRNKNLKYNIAGRSADLSLVQKYFDDKKISGNLNVMGQVTNEELYNALNGSDIFIMLSELQSSGDFEGFGIAVIEANYFGLPAIGSKNSGLEDAINNGMSGILVDPHDPLEISDAIETIKENYSEYSNGAREWAREHHWSKIVLRYIKAIDNIKRN